MSVKKDFVMPIVVLLFICLFVSAALAVVNGITRPIIDANASQRAAEERKHIIPEADGFEPLNLDSLRAQGGLPRTVTEIYRTTNDTGYIFSISVRGYGRDEIKLLCGIDMDGRIIRATVMSHSETQGLGTPIFEEPHAGQYWGRDRGGIEAVAAITGATITSVSFKNAMRDALTAYEIVLRSAYERSSGESR